MGSNDYIKFITKQVVQYLDAPPKKADEPKEEKVKEERTRASYLTTLFGSIPMGVRMVVQRNVRVEKEKQQDESENETG